jgi:hypothetical protein
MAYIWLKRFGIVTCTDPVSTAGDVGSCNHCTYTLTFAQHHVALWNIQFMPYVSIRGRCTTGCYTSINLKSNMGARLSKLMLFPCPTSTVN